jgi:hypothetical protein
MSAEYGAPVMFCRIMMEAAANVFLSTEKALQANVAADFGMMVGAAGKLRDFRAGDVIFKQGDTGQELFIIQSGKVEIRIGNHAFDTLRPAISSARWL